MKKLLTVISALALGFMSAPTLAQDESEGGMAEVDAMSAIFGGLFTAEPLTADEEARLPLASTLIVKMMPDGWYAKVMEETVTPMLAPLMEMVGSSAMSAIELSDSTGLSYDRLSELTEADRDGITAIIDPAFGERNGLMMEHMVSAMMGMMGEMEPALREGMSKAYARGFTAAQLQDIAAFYDTPTGAIFASKSLQIAADPQVMSASAQMAPMMMERLPVIFEEIEQLAADLPPERGFADLTGQEQSNLASLLDVSVEELEEGMGSAANSEEWEEEEWQEDAGE